MREKLKKNSINIENPINNASVCDIDGGRKIKIQDFRGDTVVVDFNKICPDGDVLTSPEKEWIRGLIRDSIYKTFNADPANSKVAYIYCQANEQLIWAYWLIGRGVTREDEITDALFGEFISLAREGVDTLFDSRRKVWEALCRLEGEKGRAATISMSVSDIYKAACLSPSLAPHLRGANLAIKQFKQGSAELPKWGGRARPINRGTLSRKASSIRVLHAMFDGAGASADSFEATVAETRSACAEGGKTRLIPHNLAIRLLDQAMLWVHSVNPVLMKLREKLRMEVSGVASADENEGRSNLAIQSNEQTARQRYIDEANAELQHILHLPLVDGLGDGINVRSAMNIYAPAADWIVTGAMTARRAGELQSLSHGAISGDEVSGWWIRTYIAKTLQKPDLTPCPRIVVEAVYQLENFSKAVREQTGAKELMNVRLRDDGKSMTFALRENLNKFAELVGAKNYTLNAMKVVWVYAPHQLRKLFAVLYVWRYDAGDIHALAYHLRHFNIRMTMRYCYDGELAKEIAFQTTALTKAKLRDYAKDATSTAGVYGKKLKKLIERAIGAIHLVSDEMLDKKLSILIKDKNIALKATPWGFCACKSTPSNLRRAACQKPDCRSSAKDLDGKPDPSGSDEVRCASCLFFATDGTRKEHWSQACDSARRLVERPESSRLQLVKFEKRLKVLMAVQGVL